MISIIKAREHARYRGCFLSVRPQRINVLFKFDFCTARLRVSRILLILTQKRDLPVSICYLSR